MGNLQRDLAGAARTAAAMELPASTVASHAWRESDYDVSGAAVSGVQSSPSDHKVYSDWPKEIVGGGLKRAFDVIGASALLVLLLPVFVFVAARIWACDGGSPIYRHKRVGVGGKYFDCLKFRSMVLDSDLRLAQHLTTHPEARVEWNRDRKLSDDPRITPIGRFIRATSIDELPQIWNVLIGDMSLIGPRPVVSEELARYDLNRVHYLRARPGLTGLWQVSGRSLTSYEKRVSLDKEYVLRWSFVRDLQILFRTISVVLLRRGAI